MKLIELGAGAGCVASPQCNVPCHYHDQHYLGVGVPGMAAHILGAKVLITEQVRSPQCMHTSCRLACQYILLCRLTWWTSFIGIYRHILRARACRLPSTNHARILACYLCF